MTRNPTIKTPPHGRSVAVVGDVYRFLATGEDTNGMYAVWEAIVPPGGGPPRTHVGRDERMEFVEVTVYYLEMLAPSHRCVPAPRNDLAVVHVPSPTVPYYRSLYGAVGKEYHWLSRRKMSDDTLATLLGDPGNELHVLHVAGTPAGFAELDRRQHDEIELVQFGLMVPFIGRGLGEWFLQWAMDKAWSYGPKRLWLHTCTLDHPAALPNYTRAGFVLFRQEAIRREL